MKPEYQDLYRRDQQRLADWPPKFRGEGPFLPTGRRKPARLLLTSLAVAGAALVSLVSLQWKTESFDSGFKRGSPDMRGPGFSLKDGRPDTGIRSSAGAPK